MIKRFSIALLFFTAFAVMMAHSFIPHQHHEEQTTADHHDNDHHEDDDDEGLANLFLHFQHTAIEHQFSVTDQQTSVKKLQIQQSVVALTTALNAYFADTGEPVPILLSYDPNIFTSFFVASASLRGPPSITV